MRVHIHELPDEVSSLSELLAYQPAAFEPSGPEPEMQQMAYDFGHRLGMVSMNLLWSSLQLEEARRRNAELSAQVAELGKDRVTDLLVRSVFEDRLRSELGRHPDSGGTLALLDLDHFKDVNDTVGHLNGDKVLADVSHTLRSSIRHGDLAGRYGGEELILFLNGIEPDKAQPVIDRIRGLMSAISLPKNANGLTGVSGSFGLAHIDSAYDIEGAIARADAALYYVKHTGRDNAAIYSSDGIHQSMY